MNLYIQTKLYPYECMYVCRVNWWSIFTDRIQHYTMHLANTRYASIQIQKNPYRYPLYIYIYIYTYRSPFYAIPVNS